MTRKQALAISALKIKIDAMQMLQVVEAPKLQPQELFLQIGRKRYQVASIQQAVNNHGTHLYGISYNGRVWGGAKALDGMNDDQWVAHVTGKQND
jgi:hypothetical protein